MRPSRDQWAMSLAVETSRRATCLRRAVGAVLLDARGHVMATGYNGVASGLPHCNEEEIVYRHLNVREGYNLSVNLGCGVPMTLKSTIEAKDEVVEATEYPHACPGAQAPSGQNLDGCQAIHAEQNALLQCRDVYAIHTCYTTASPCLTCVKLLLNTGCVRIVYRELYPQPEALALWASARRLSEKL